jgi:hypothetical protein
MACQSLTKTMRVKGTKLHLRVINDPFEANDINDSPVGDELKGKHCCCSLSNVAEACILSPSVIFNEAQQDRQNFFALRNQKLTNIFPLNDQFKNLIFKSVNRLRKKICALGDFFFWVEEKAVP